MIGKTIRHYKILEKLGEGGMGVVYKAEDTKLERLVALKFLPLHVSADEEEKQRFIHEAKAASALDHPNVCAIYEIGESEDGQMFIAMAYYEGEPLQDKIKHAPLDLAEALDIATQIALGLERAHEADIVHRDLKPANIILTDRGEVKILDFGLAKLRGQTKLTKAGTTLGTAAYMSPEQAQGQDVDRRSDLFPFGAMLFEMLTGQHPFQGEYEMTIMYSIMNEDPVPLTELRTGVPMALERVINKTLEKDKELRYQSASDLLADLKKISRELETGERAVVKKRSTVNKGRKWLRILTPLTIVLGVVIAFLLLRPVFQDEPLVSSPKPLVVLPFENQTGDSNFDYLRTAIPNLLITNLQQSKYLTVLTWERMQDLLKLMDKTELDVIDIDKEIGFELCQLEGVHGIVLGSFTRAGDVFATDIKVLDVATKKLLKSANSKGTGVSSILQKQIDELSEAISTVATLSAPEAEREILRLADVTTHSMEAYRLYLNGVRLFHEFITISAREELEKALEFDPSFAMAYYYLSRTNRNIGNIADAEAALRNAKAHAEQATLRELLFINMDYATRIEKDRSKALTINQELVKRFPREKRAHFFLALKYRGLGRYEDAIRAHNQVLKLDPNWGNVYNDLGYIYIYTKNYAKSEESFRKYASLSPNQPNPFDSLGELLLTVGRLDDAILNCKKSLEVNSFWYPGIRKLAYIYALKENYPEFYRHYDDYFSKFEQFLSIDEDPGVMMGGYRQFGVIIFLLGRYQEALEIYQKMADLAHYTGDERTRALAHELKAFVFAEMENYEQAENQLQASLAIRMRLPNEERPRWQAAKECFSGLLDVKLGKTESAREKLGKVKQALPEITDARAEIYAYWSSFLEAEVLLAEGSPGQAIAAIQQAALPDPFHVIRHLNEYTMPVLRDVVARAYYAAGDLDNAIEEYQRLLKFDENGQGRFLIDPQYHFRLAKLYEEKGWPGLAIQEYQTFLEIWKDADQGLQELLDAKNRLSNLQGVAG